MQVTSGARSDVGRVRTINEDSYLDSAPVFAVADGMGGHAAGEVASETAIEVVTAAGDARPPEASRLAQILQDANRAIWDRARSDSELGGMGTTCSMVVIDDLVAHIAHVGDSRIYLLRDGAMRQLTEDHTLVARLVREGRIKPEDVERHPQRSVITRALGVDEHVDVDVFDEELHPGDRLLICSDGLSSMVDDGSIAREAGAGSPQQAAERLVDMANEAGGEDNVTVILIEVGNGSAGRAATPTPREEEAEEETSSEVTGRPGRKAPMVAGLVLVLLLAAGAGAVYAINNLLWYVGADDTGRVAIFHGVPEEIVGMKVGDVAESTDLALEELPEFAREDVQEGRKVTSLEEARSYVENLRARAAEFAPSPSPTPTRGRG